MTFPSNPTFKLNTGAEIPCVGLGTWKAKPGEVRLAVAHALKCGYRHIDCAMAYGNEEEVGMGIKDSGIKREEIFLTSKVWCTYQDRVSQCLEITLSSLQTSYLDLYLIHWPVRLVPNGTSERIPTKPDGSRNIDWTWSQADTWKQMEDLYFQGKVKAIGISNFSEILIKDLLKDARVVPAVNQVEVHPYNPEIELQEYCENKGIRLQAYSPLGSVNSPLHSDPQVKSIAEKHNVSIATILLSWLVNRGIVVLPKSVTPARITNNHKIIDLDPEDIGRLNNLAANGKQQRLICQPWGSDFGFPHYYGYRNKDAPEGARLLAGRS